MKTIQRFFIIMLVFVVAGYSSFAQTEQDSKQVIQKQVIHKIIKQNGSSFIGTIISKDAHEILLQTEDVGLVYIPKHEIDEIVEVKEGEKAVTGGLFATRYFLTTNGLNINKGDNYVLWNLYGPDFQFGVADNVTLGIMTSWLGMPIIGTAKYSRKIADKVFGGVGFLGGTGSWAFPQYGLMLPYGFLSVGDRVNNLNVSVGYGLLFSERSEYTYIISQVPTEYSTNSIIYDNNTYNDTEGRALFSVAGMFRINDKFSFVFDSFFMLGGPETSHQERREAYNDQTNKVTYSVVTVVDKSNPLVVLSPGLRFQATENSSFQFGFTGIHFDGEFIPAPIPMVQWFKRI
ncbi:MAG: hypothetical protein KAH17_07640 [Bacteroidales bacterium]|nr:hypothetical protein [Bacteroidales bacterium]